jgi:acetate kinase
MNCGSSSLKFALHEFGEGNDSQTQVARGAVEGIAADATFRVTVGAARGAESIQARDHAAAARFLLGWLDSNALSPRGYTGIGHRVVHGGSSFTGPQRVTDELLEQLDALRGMAPLHSGPALDVVRETSRSLGAGVPHAVSFDTAFHRTMPDRARYYAISPELARQGDFQRYGFHGLAHRSMLETVARRRAQEPDQLRLVTVQLGSGCSAAAIESGRSIDTSMGLTPLEGLPMATRSGDVDPSLVALVAGATGRSPGDVVQELNVRSGLLGVSGLSSDVRVLLDAETAGHEGARLALEIFCYRVRKQVGAYLAALGGADAIVFGGGIGENVPVIRQRVCEGLEWCGVHLDRALNERTSDTARISRVDSAIEVWVAAVDEESLIAHEAREVLRRPVPR